MLGRCKFGTDCSYLHDVPLPNGDIVNEIKVMQEELQFVTNALKTKKTEIFELKEKVNKAENILMTGEFQQSKNEFKCNLCEYKCKSETVLRRHISRKHKPETLRLNPEHMNDSISLHLSTVLDRKEDCSNETGSSNILV